ncbi:hypothetical protein PMAYCL1PPCAC_08888, partial [Pristionchus mayeri]
VFSMGVNSILLKVLSLLDDEETNALSDRIKTIMKDQYANNERKFQMIGREFGKSYHNEIKNALERSTRPKYAKIVAKELLSAIYQLYEQSNNRYEVFAEVENKVFSILDERIREAAAGADKLQSLE